MSEMEQPQSHTALTTRLQSEMGAMVDDLLKSENLSEVTEITQINNKMRYAMLRIINLKMGEAAEDPKMIAAWKGLIKDIDSAVFILARLSQEDRHLDNEEMVAQALNAVTQQIRKNPYKVDSPLEDMEIPPLPSLPDDEFDFKEGSDLIGLITEDYKDFQDKLGREAIALEDGEEVTTRSQIDRDTPLPPPTPGSLRL